MGCLADQKLLYCSSHGHFGHMMLVMEDLHVQMTVTSGSD
uniref:Uncharacterized protein n=1 Tax=Arundo donax TaxID=35708 RepID=A0A0A9DUD1_ARUDO